MADFYRDNGYAVVRQVFTGDELAELQRETEAQIIAGPDRQPAQDFLCNAMPDCTERFFRIDWTTDDAKHLLGDALSAAAAHPFVHEVVRDVLHGSCVLTSSTLVFKDRGGGPEVALHRDDFPDRQRFHPSHNIISADVYLDTTNADNGCLKIIPGSHRIDNVISDIQRNLDHPDLIAVEMYPGDVLFHDSRLLHGSSATGKDASLRRVLYYVWQCPEWLHHEGYVPGLHPPKTWVAELLRLSRHLFDVRAARHGDSGRDYAIAHHWHDDVAKANLITRPHPTWVTEEQLASLRALFVDSSGPAAT